MTPKEARTPISFDLFVAATKNALCVCEDHGSVAEFVVESMSYQADHPELDMLTVFGIILENYKRGNKLP
jgi:hypothetical protein